MSQVRNEQIKLTASWLNTIAAASVTTGFIAPTVAYALGISVAVSAAGLGVLSVIWLAIGIGLHLAARRVLKGLSP